MTTLSKVFLVLSFAMAFSAVSLASPNNADDTQTKKVVENPKTTYSHYRTPQAGSYPERNKVKVKE
ncbi:MAG: hypothetical protein IJ849_08700 [Selenomonadaceae bacterium]|nr:hypothetical protein [Selenomonadaceae bacterium]